MLHLRHRVLGLPHGRASRKPRHQSIVLGGRVARTERCHSPRHTPLGNGPFRDHSDPPLPPFTQSPTKLHDSYTVSPELAGQQIFAACLLCASTEQDFLQDGQDKVVQTQSLVNVLNAFSLNVRERHMHTHSQYFAQLQRQSVSWQGYV